MSIEKKDFGFTREGKKISSYTISNAQGGSVTVLDFGAVLKNVYVPDREGKLTDVVLGYDDLAHYEVNGPCFGATIGRSGNRIAGASFVLDGCEYHLAKNENENNLHSGPFGFHFRPWMAEVKEENNAVSFLLDSPDGDQGYPGNFLAKVTYTLTDDNAVDIHYEGTADAKTVVNMTNHSYWNLNGEGSGSILDQYLEIEADGFTPVNEKLIPIGMIQAVEGTPFDFRHLKTIGQDAAATSVQLEYGNGYDHNFAVIGTGYRKAAYAVSDKSGITLTVMTDQPGMQFYAGNSIGTEEGKGGKTYHSNEGFALETQHFPNSVNTPEFESPVLNANEKYDTRTTYILGLL